MSKNRFILFYRDRSAVRADMFDAEESALAYLERLTHARLIEKFKEPYDSRRPTILREAIFAAIRESATLLLANTYDVLMRKPWRQCLVRHEVELATIDGVFRDYAGFMNQARQFEISHPARTRRRSTLDAPQPSFEGMSEVSRQGTAASVAVAEARRIRAREVIDEIKQQFGDDLTNTEIARHLNARGIPTLKSAKEWTYKSVGLVLS